MPRSVMLAFYKPDFWCVQATPTSPPVSLSEYPSGFSLSESAVMVAVPDSWVVNYQENVDPTYDDELCYLAAATFASEVCAVQMDELIFQYQLLKKDDSAPLLSINAISLDKLDEISAFLKDKRCTPYYILESDMMRDAVKKKAFHINRTFPILEPFSPVKRNKNKWVKQAKKFTAISLLSHFILTCVYFYFQASIPVTPDYVSPWGRSHAHSQPISALETSLLEKVQGMAKTIRLDALSLNAGSALVRITGTQSNLSLLAEQWRTQLKGRQFEFSSVLKSKAVNSSKQEGLYEATIQIR
ncbi:hypothetical protein [Marinomonas balearica]|uniref:Uncharacterized protein n=1 Tax=Marinomonas balearica TaxID=491947 RepID=A0A4R6M2W4_9GAMM|nr:hypothetical protein [Marinomonas balearica]TDO95563.1 hypothetical protein DFP79_3494 [Marinomonas balearica]